MSRLDLYVDFKRFVAIKLTKGDVVIGRAGDCDIQLPAETVSRHHTRIRAGGGGWLIEDLSTNGTRVNASMIDEPTPLSSGDRIYIENYVLIFQADDMPPESLDEEATTLHGDPPSGSRRAPR